MGLPWWIVILSVVGALALATGFITLFSSLGRRPRKVLATEAPPVESDDFLLSLGGTINAPLQKGGTVRLLNNGDEFFTALLEAIAGARHSINVSVYIWEPGRATDMVVDALVERAGAGVQVRVLVDALGGLRMPREGIDRLRNAGAKVERFRRARLGKLTRFYKRNHRRAIVIDGRIAFTGGAAFGDKWLGNAQDEDHWRDSMVEVTGCIAANLQGAFAEPWAYTSGEILVGDEYYPSHEGDGDSGIRSIGVVSSPSSEEHPLRLMFLLSFMAAREKLYIQSSYFVPDEHTRKIVADRARAGVDVRVLVPDGLTDAKPIRLAGRSYYDELLSAGVRIYEYQGTMMHAKHVVIDGAWSVVGSANMDVRSKELNLENVLGILDPAFAQTIETTFLADTARGTEIRLDAWRRRGLWERIKERFWVLFAEQY